MTFIIIKNHFLQNGLKKTGHNNVARMKIFQPELEDQDEGYATSFTFDNLDEQNSFSSFLENMGIGFLKSKFPVIEDGKMKFQTGFVVPVPKSETDQVESHEVVVNEVVQEVSEEQVDEVVSKKKSKKAQKE
jgi:hypothetical protein